MEMSVRDKEKLDVLAGDRGDKSQAAVRMAAVKALLDNVPTDPTGNAANDIKALFAAFNAMRIALR